MKTMTKNTIAMATGLGRRGFAVTGIEVQTADGRAWTIEPRPSGCFHLFEIGDDEPIEHDAVDGDGWLAGDLIDYLAAVGAARRPVN